jgi:lambda family phage portal protein
MFGLFRKRAISAPRRQMSFAPSGEFRLQRGYDAAEMGRLVEDWLSPDSSVSTIIGPKLQRIRNRCRDLERNDDYVRKFATEVETNIVGSGPGGTALVMKVMDTAPDAFRPGKPDKRANFQIETAWFFWGKRANASANRQMSWRKIEAMCARRRFIDGEVFVRIIEGASNPYGFALQIIDADYVPLDYSQEPRDGFGRIKMGIEYDRLGAPTYYWIYSAHPSDGEHRQGAVFNGKFLERVPAEKIIHYFSPERPDQTRGIPELVSCVMRLRQLKGYEDAEVVAARIGASKMGFFRNDDGASYKGDGTDKDGVPISDAEPGTFANIGSMHFQQWDPNHPNANYEGFRKAVLRGVAAGMGVNYNVLANDLEGVNYSSMRGGMLDEREMWMLKQADHHELLCDPVFEAWLPMALLSGAIRLPFAKLNKFMSQTWVGRRWKWVDPMKEAQGYVLAIKNGLTSRLRVLIEQGLDIEEVDQENSDDLKRQKALGLSYGEEPKPAVKPAPAEEEPEDKEEEETPEEEEE